MTNDEMDFILRSNAMAGALIHAMQDQNPAIAAIGAAEATGRLVAYMAATLFADEDSAVDTAQRKRLLNTAMDRMVTAYFETLEKISSPKGH